MKAIFKKAVFMLVAAITFAACEDVPAPYPTPGTGNEGEEATEEVAEGDGTLATPYNAKAANDFIATLAADVESENNIYVKGVISSIKENSTTQYGNATFYISDDGTTSSEQFYVFRAYGLDNKKFTQDNALNVGDEVIICGKVVNFKGNTPETVQNKAYIYSLNGNGGNGGGGDEPVIDGENLLANGDFEAWENGVPTNWKSASTAGNATLSQSSDAHGGSYSVAVAGTTANKRLAYKEITLKSGTYTFSFYAKATVSDKCQCRPGYVPVVNGSVGDYAYGSYEAVKTSGWTLINHTFTLDAQTTVCLVVMNPKGGTDYQDTQDILIDDASLKTNDGGVVDGGNNNDTPDTPSGDVKEITVAEALAILAGMEPAAQTNEEYIVCGKVESVTEISAQYGNATVVLEGGFTLFRFKDFNGANFTDENAIKVGDEVKVKGYLKNYVKDDVVTPELVNGTLVELNGKSEGGNTGGNDDPNVNPGEGGGKVITFIAGTDMGSITDYNNHGADTMTKNGVTISITDGCLGLSTDYRTYKSNSMTIKSSVGNIVGIEFSCTANDDTKQGPGCWTPDNGNYTYSGKIGTWSGDAASVVFSADANQVRATKIVVTLK